MACLSYEAARSKKAQNPVILDVRKISSFCDYFIITSGSSSVQLEAIRDGVEEKLEAEGFRPLHSEGQPKARWLLLDYGGLVVHIFSEEAREFYALERLWFKAKKLTIKNDKNKKRTKPKN